MGDVGGFRVPASDTMILLCKKVKGARILFTRRSIFPFSPNPGVTVIWGMHAMFYSSQAAELRLFLRDKLGLKGVDVGGGWLIFDAPEADLGVHPTENGEPASGTSDISFYCDDIQQTVSELKARGVEFTQDVADHGYGLVTYFKAPGDFKVQLYQPKYSK
jgi:hypothetical protein